MLIHDSLPSLFPVLARHGEGAITALEAELDKVLTPDWADSPPDPGWRELSAQLRRVIEAAAGMVEERFVVCQTLPYAQLHDVIGQLRSCGYRPRCVRPYRVGASLLAAVVWVRDNVAWEWLSKAEVEQLLARDADQGKRGFVPIEVSVDPGPGGPPPRYTAVWEQANVAGPEVRVMAGPLGEPEQQALASLVEQKFNCVSSQVALDDQGRPHGASLWTYRKDQQRSTTRHFHDLAEHFREDECPGLLLTDARLFWGEVEVDGRRGPVLLTTALWNVSTQFESKALHGLSIMEQRLLGLQLAAEGFRPAAISVVAERENGLPIATTVWHRPLVSEEAKEQLAKRQANAAVSLLKLERERKVWPILQHGPDPRARSYLIHRFGPLGADPGHILTQLDRQDDVSIRRALILTLGEFSDQRFPPAGREGAMPRLLDLYANDPDSGIHGAVAWTLRRWGRQADLQVIDQEFATGSPVGNRRWFVNRQRRTLVIVPPPGEFLIGSPPKEVGREGGPEGDHEMQRFVRIDYAFAVMSHQVTVAEFLEFRQDFSYRITFSPESGCPINNVTWYDAVAYCNWLNEKDGVAREQWCYLPNNKGEYAEGMSIVPDCLRRSGYRLLTDAEWEFVCRAGSVTSRYYGQSWDLDNHYACNVRNSMGRCTSIVGSFKPNDLGLFDMLGNITDWCHTAYWDHSSAPETKFGGELLLPEVVRNNSRRVLRSPSFILSLEHARAAYHQGFVPNARAYLMGFRVSRECGVAEHLDREEKVTNSQPRLVSSSAGFQGSGQTRCSYRSNYPPNFRAWPWGFRTARTID